MRTTGRSGRGRWIFLAAVVVVLVIAWLVVDGMIRSAAAARLPAPPDPSGLTDATARHLREADAAAREAPRDAEAVGGLALAYHADGFSTRARQCYELALDLAPDDRELHYGRALLLLERGQPEEAARGFRSVVELEDDSPLAWFWLGDCRFKLSEDAAAEAAYRRAAELGRRRSGTDRTGIHRFPVSAHASLGLARVAERQGRIEDAVAILAPLTGTHALFGAAQRLLASLLRRLGRDEEAARHQELAGRCRRFIPPEDPFVDELTRRSTSSAFLTKQANLAWQADDLEWAEALARRARDANPEEGEIYVLYHDILAALNRYGEALECVVIHRRLDPGHEVIGQLLVQTLQRTVDDLTRASQHRMAEHVIRETIRRCPDDPFLHSVLGDFLVRTGRAAQGVAELREALAAREDPEVRTNLGTALAMAGDPGAGISQFRRVLKVAPDHARATTNLAMLLVQAGRREEAEAALSRMADLADALLDERSFEEAAEVTARLLELRRDDPEAHVLRARWALGTGRRTEARRLLERALKLDPEHPQALTLDAALSR